MSEKAISFGEGGRMVGVFAEPSGGCRPAERPAVLFWNVGMLHHVGPFRLYVSLARRLADLGFCSLRFDLSGLGDSLAAPDDRPRRERVVSEVGAAADWLAARGPFEGIVLVGLCSGADDAHAVAMADTRVRGAVLVDGYGYPTRRFRFRRYADFLRSPERVVRYARRRLAAMRGAPSDPGVQEEFGWELPPRAQVQADIQALVERGVRQLYVYSGGVHTYYNYAEQFDDMFPGLKTCGLVRHAYFPEADHIFTDSAQRQRLEEMVAEWMRAGFSPA